MEDESQRVSNSVSCGAKTTGLSSPPYLHVRIKSRKMLYAWTVCQSFHLTSYEIILNCFLCFKIYFFYTGHGQGRKLWWTFTLDIFCQSITIFCKHFVASHTMSSVSSAFTCCPQSTGFSVWIVKCYNCSVCFICGHLWIAHTFCDIHKIFFGYRNISSFIVPQSSCLTLWSRSLSKCYLRIQSVPQREHHTSPLQRSTC
jgi:hypothetical protein